MTAKDLETIATGFLEIAAALEQGFDPDDKARDIETLTRQADDAEAARISLRDLEHRLPRGIRANLDAAPAVFRSRLQKECGEALSADAAKNLQANLRASHVDCSLRLEDVRSQIVLRFFEAIVAQLKIQEALDPSAGVDVRSIYRINEEAWRADPLDALETAAGTDVTLRSLIASLQSLLNSVEYVRRQDEDGPKASRFKPKRRIEYESEPPPQWLVKNLLMPDGVGMIIGQSQAFKTFIALYLGVAIVSGRDAFGDGSFPVRRTGTVIMAVGEAQASFKSQRIPALEKYLGLSLRDFPHFVVGALPLASSTPEVQQFVAEIREATAGEPPIRLVVLDTLNVMAGGMDENAAKDMGRVIEAAKYISSALGCLVLIIHHPAKGATADLPQFQMQSPSRLCRSRRRWI